MSRCDVALKEKKEKIPCVKCSICGFTMPKKQSIIPKLCPQCYPKTEVKVAWK